MLGLYEPTGRLRFVGQAGSGFSVSEAEAVEQVLKLIEVAEPPFARPPRVVEARTWSWASSSVPGPVRWCEPRLVCRVEYTEFTDAGLLRHPAFRSMQIGAPPDGCKITGAPGWLGRRWYAASVSALPYCPVGAELTQ